MKRAKSSESVRFKPYLRYSLNRTWVPGRRGSRLAQNFWQRGPGDSRDLFRIGAPERRVHQFERHPAVIAEPTQHIEDRRQLKIAVARQNAVGVGGQLARDA